MFPEDTSTQTTSNGNTECAGKPKQLYSLCDQLLGVLMFLCYCSAVFSNDYAG